MLSVENASARYGLNPLEEVISTVALVVGACGKKPGFEALARTVQSDVVQTAVYNGLCAYLEKFRAMGFLPEPAVVRKQCLTMLFLQMAHRGFRADMLALTEKTAKSDEQKSSRRGP